MVSTPNFYSQKDADYICITDMARYKDEERTDYIIQNWLRNRNTIEFLGIWEQLNNSGFNPIEFEGFRKQAGLNSFSLTAKRWIEVTNAIGLISRAGRYGGTYAHKDIAFESNYYPDFLVKVSDREVYIVETKGLEDMDVPLKMERLRQWCEDINHAQANVRYDYVFVDEDGFNKYRPSSFRELVGNFTGYKEKS